MNIVFKLIIINFIIFTNLHSIENNVSEKDSNLTLIKKNMDIVKINDELNIIKKEYETNIWLTKYKTYLTYRSIQSELYKIKKEIIKYSRKSSKKYEELTYQLNNRIKVKQNELSLLKEYKDSPIGHSIKPKDIPLQPKVTSPISIVEAYTYIQKIKNYNSDYKNINTQLISLIKIINNKIDLYNNLYDITKDPLVSRKIEDLNKQFKDFVMVADIVSTTSNVYNRKIDQVILEVNSSINEEIKRTIKLSLIILILILISLGLKKGAKRYVIDDDNQYLAYKLINFSLIIIIVFILLFSYIDNASYLVTVLGFASAGIAIALKDWFMSIFGWMAIMTSGAIKVGDRIKVTKDKAEIVGDVLDISLFKISIREDVTLTSYRKNRRTGRVFFVPNNYIFTDLISNYTYDGLRTVWDGIDINITFDSNHKKANALAKKVADAHAKGYTELAKKRLGKMKRKYILRSASTEPRVFSFVESYGIVISTWYHTNSYATLGLRSTISMAIFDAFQAEDDITIAYPTQTINSANKAEVKNLPIDDSLFDILNMKILLLEDDELFSSSLIDFLECEGYSVFHANNSNNFLNLTYQYNYDLYILDINIPDINGLKLLKLLRDASDNTATIFLTSYKDKQTLIDGFKCGADDFLVKPFNSDELVLRIEALLKRSGKLLSDVYINNIKYDINNRNFVKNGEIINITKKVSQLFELFLKHDNKIISKDEIVDNLWSYNQDYSDGSIRVYISKLKDILGKDSILNIKGQGYKAKFK